MTYPRLIISAVGLVLILVGAFRLGSEIFAFDRDVDIAFALRDGDGFASAAIGKAISAAFRSGDWIALDELATAGLSDAPFDPVLLSLRSVARAKGGDVNPHAIAEELDRAVLIAGDHPDIETLRQVALSALLQDRTKPTGTEE